MSSNDPANNSSNNSKKRRTGDRRKNRTGTPPPGTVIDRRLGLEARESDSPSNDWESNPSNNGKLVSSKKSTKTQSKSDSSSETTGLERKRGRGRRLSEFTKSAEEGEMTPEQFLFLMAIDAFKKGNDRMFPTWTDVLEVVRLLGYRKTMASELNLSNAEDWFESPHAPSNVRPDRWSERFTASETNSLKVGAASKGPKTEKELTDEALEAFEAAFGDADSAANEDFTNFDEEGFNEAA